MNLFNFPKSRLAGISALTLTLAACGATSTMELSRVKANPFTQFDAPVDEQASFVLSRIVASVPRGEVIAHYPSSGVAGVKAMVCNPGPRGTENVIEWSQGSAAFGDWRSELGEIFFDALAGRGVNIQGDPSQLFEQADYVQGAEYQIGGRITEIRGNLCRGHNFWTGQATNKVAGEMYVSVEWTIRSSIQKRNVAKFETEGYFLQREMKLNGLQIAFHNAFAAAAEAMIDEKQFVEIATRQIETAGAEVEGNVINLRGEKLHNDPFANNPSRVTDAVVTIRLGGGHGSGFFFSEDGYILTNEHVVGEADKVAVVLSNGLEIEGTVERRHRRRDVALVKVPVRAPNALAVRRKPVKVLEPVFAVGSPGFVELQSTVTAGVVSAKRYWEKEKIEIIQSDVAISGGSSGGAFVDVNGNVLGLTVASYTNQQNLNLFIPIVDALESLKINLTPPSS